MNKIKENNNIEELLNNEVIKKLWIESKEFKQLMTYYECAIMEIQTKLNVLDAQFSMMHDRNPISSIKTRIKKPISIKKKMEKRNFPYNFESMEKNLNDIAGVRVVCSFIDDVYMLAESLTKQDDITLLREKDYIKNPKPNGYRSLHLIVSVPIFLADQKKSMKVEIQLRTIAMDFWASLEHQLRYKKNFKFNEKTERELYECAHISSILDNKMEDIRKIVKNG